MLYIYIYTLITYIGTIHVVLEYYFIFVFELLNFTLLHSSFHTFCGLRLMVRVDVLGSVNPNPNPNTTPNLNPNPNQKPLT